MHADKTRARIIAEFDSLLRDESAHIAKYTRTGFRIKVAGIVFLLVALVIVGTPWHWPTAAAALFAAMGAFLAGLSVAYDSSLRSWPIIRPLLKDDALEILKSEGRVREG